jgi:cephalosporin hydroxylase
VAAAIGRGLAGKRVMVSLDAEHGADHVRAEIRNFGPLVTPGCYLVVEDGIFDLTSIRERQRIGGHRIPDEGGPLHAIVSELVGNPGWIRDTAVEQQTPLTYHPAGWWVKA